MKSLGLILFVIVLAAPLRAQGVLSVTTDKDTYTHGESIEVRVRIDNPTNETFYLNGSSSCQAQFKLDDAGPFVSVCTTDSIQIQFNPGSWREWIWVFDPTVFGLAAVDGKVTVIGYYPGSEMVDSLVVEAPAYIGGHLSVNVLSHVTADDLQPVLDALNVTILDTQESSDGRRETWRIEGTSLSTAVDTYASDQRFGYFEAIWLHISPTVVDTEAMPERPDTSPTVSIYPNPCHTLCDIDFSSELYGTARIDIFDVQGRSVAGRIDAAGHFDATALPAGVYVVRVLTRDSSVSKTFIVAH